MPYKCFIVFPGGRTFKSKVLYGKEAAIYRDRMIQIYEKAAVGLKWFKSVRAA